MDTELKKISVQIGEMLPSADALVSVEGDIIVPDVKPDAKKIMSADADACVKKCEISGNVLKVSGTVFANIIYIPEGDEPCAPSGINTRFDFSENLQIPTGENIKATACATVRHIDFSLINSRKLNLKVYVGLSSSAFSQKSFDYIDNPDSEKVLETMRTPLKLCNITDNETSEILVSENIELPQQKADIGEVLKVTVEPCGAECKVMTDKLLVKGILCVSLLYISADTDEEAECLTAEIPLSDVLSVENIDENSCACVNLSVKDFYYSIKNDINDNPRIVNFEALIDANVFAYKITECEPVADCYLPGCESITSHKEISACELLCDENIRLNIREKVADMEAPALEVLTCFLKPIISEQVITPGAVAIKGLLAGGITIKTDDDTLVFHALELPFEHTQNISGITDSVSVMCSADILSKNHNISGGTAEIFTVLNINLKAVKPVTFNVATACEQAENPSASSQPMLVIYFVQNGDTVWDIAKRYKTTAKKIFAANNLTENDKICTGMKLLIPAV